MNRFVLFVLFVISGCTDASFSKIKNLGSSAHIICRSGGVVFYDGWSSGKVQSEANSDGYFFVEEGTGITREISGDCMISVGEKRPSK